MQTKFVILDEADMMLNVGFADDVEHILQGVPEERQTMLFSATMPSWVKNLTQKYLNNPVLVDLVGDAQSGKIADSIRSAAAGACPLCLHPTVSTLTQSRIYVRSLTHAVQRLKTLHLSSVLLWGLSARQSACQTTILYKRCNLHRAGHIT